MTNIGIELLNLSLRSCIAAGMRCYLRSLQADCEGLSLLVLAMYVFHHVFYQKIRLDSILYLLLYLLQAGPLSLDCLFSLCRMLKSSVATKLRSVSHDYLIRVFMDGMSHRDARTQ